VDFDNLGTSTGFVNTNVVVQQKLKLLLSDLRQGDVNDNKDLKSWRRDREEVLVEKLTQPKSDSGLVPFVQLPIS
jgi:hypothetical protein